MQSISPGNLAILPACAACTSPVPAPSRPTQASPSRAANSIPFRSFPAAPELSGVVFPDAAIDFQLSPSSQRLLKRFLSPHEPFRLKLSRSPSTERAPGAKHLPFYQAEQVSDCLHFSVHLRHRSYNSPRLVWYGDQAHCCVPRHDRRMNFLRAASRDTGNVRRLPVTVQIDAHLVIFFPVLGVETIHVTGWPNQGPSSRCFSGHRYHS